MGGLSKELVFQDFNSTIVRLREMEELEKAGLNPFQFNHCAIKSD